MNAISTAARLITAACITPAAWAAESAGPATTQSGNTWLLVLAGLAALLFIGRRNTPPSRADTPEPQRPPRP